jgi:hypothetical protein
LLKASGVEFSAFKRFTRFHALHRNAYCFGGLLQEKLFAICVNFKEMNDAGI